MALDSGKTDLATIAYQARREALDTAKAINPIARMASDSHVRDMAALDLLEASTEMMGDDEVRTMIESILKGRKHSMACADEDTADSIRAAATTLHEMAEIICERLHDRADDLEAA